jgi:hypothetical protein
LGFDLNSQFAFAFTSSTTSANNVSPASRATTKTSLGVSIGLGPEKAETEEEGEESSETTKELVAGVDYEIPDHEAYRTSRRSKLDEQCDQWFGALLGDETERGVMGSLADQAREILTTPVALTNEVRCVKYKQSFMLLWDNRRVVAVVVTRTALLERSLLTFVPFFILLLFAFTFTSAGRAPTRSRGMDSLCGYETTLDAAHTRLWFGGIRPADTQEKRRNVEAL